VAAALSCIAQLLRTLRTTDKNWVFTLEAVYVHQRPTAKGYDLRDTYRPGQQIPVPYAPSATVAVGELLAADRHFT
jgi:hypothetical protein